jgi:hypothetical protein
MSDVLRKPISTLCACALAVLAFSPSPRAQSQDPSRDGGAGLSGPPQINQTYASRDARRCVSLTTPPNQAQAAALIQCTMEVANTIGVKLMQNVNIQIGAPRAFQPDTDGTLKDIDIQAPIFPLSGSATAYFCNSVAYGLYHPGSNCTVTPMQQAAGVCWRTTFGDWKCNLSGPTPASRDLQPGPVTY